MTINNNNKSLDGLFKPKTVAIYEAKENVGYFIEGFKIQGYPTENLFLISPSSNELFGIKCYKSIEEVPIDTIDLLILSIRREKLIDSLRNILSHKNVNFIHFFTAGTGEFDEIGLKIEDDLKEILDSEYPNIKAIGPNCMGVYCPEGKNSYLPVFPTESGMIGLIYHSGDLCSRTIMYGFQRYSLLFSKGASIGNCVNLQVSDFLDYFNKDSETEIISIYFEGFTRYSNLEGRKLYKTLKKMRKPVLFLRGGKTKRGQSAVLTHTGSLGTDDKIWQAIYKQTVLIEVGSSLDELIDYIFMFNQFYKKNRSLTLKEQIEIYPKSKNALVILWSGGLGIIDTDTLVDLGVNLPLFDDKTKEKLMNVYPVKIGSLSNPLDLPWISRSQGYLELCKVAISENVDFIIMHSDPRRRDEKTFENYYNILKSIKNYVESLNKILVLIVPEYPDAWRNEYYEMLIRDDFIVYPDLGRAAKAFLVFYEYGQKLKRLVNKDL